MGIESVALVKPSTAKRILVVGGGLAGSMYAAEAAWAGHQVCLFDHRNPRSASRTAAGLYNIITGRKAALTWLARPLLDSLDAFLARPNFAVLKTYLHTRPIFRPYQNPEDFNDWAAVSQDPNYREWVVHHPNPLHPHSIRNPLGGISILPCGWVEVPAWLDTLQEVLMRDFKCQIVNEAFDYTALDPDTGLLAGHGIFDQVVFAEGVALADNPWFEAVEIRPLKGQVIEIQANHVEEGHVLLRKGFVIPLGGNRAVAGSTYELSFTDDFPEPEGIAQLREQAETTLCQPVQVTHARAGIRPTTPNRRPILGRHPNHERLHIINGLGTKGVLQAPWCADQLRRYMDGELPQLPESVDVARFFQKIPVL